MKLRGYFYISFPFVPTKKTVSLFKKHPFLGKAWLLAHLQCPLNMLMFCFLCGQLHVGEGKHLIGRGGYVGSMNEGLGNKMARQFFWLLRNTKVPILKNKLNLNLTHFLAHSSLSKETQG